MLIAPKRGRGRPRKAPPPKTDAEILQEISDRFPLLETLTKNVVKGTIRSMVVTGGPGVGKTYTVEHILQSSDVKFEVVKGTISPVELYKLGYRMRKPGSIIVLDDSDDIFNEEDALNILKALCDTSVVRKISWLKNSRALEDGDNSVPTSYEFEGTMIFISNVDFQAFVDSRDSRYAKHFEALMSRSMYLDLRLHTRDALAVWVKNVAGKNNIFQREGVDAATGSDILEFISENRYTLRELSIRTLLKTCQLAKSDPDNWQQHAKILLNRTSAGSN